MREDLKGTNYYGYYVYDQKIRSNGSTYLYIKCPRCGVKKWVPKTVIKTGKHIGCVVCNKRVDITGKRYGKLVAIEPTNKRVNGSIVWRCKCDCGNETFAPVAYLQRGNKTSCNCALRNRSTEHIKALKKGAEDLRESDTYVPLLLGTKKRKNNTSGINGVCYDSKRNKWLAQIQFKKKNYYLGGYDKIEDAAKARKIAENKIYGDFLQWYAEAYPEKWKKINERNGKSE